jgi:hypothetical protein
MLYQPTSEPAGSQPIAMPAGMLADDQDIPF